MAKRAQDAPKRGQETPKSSPKLAKSRPRGPKIPPKSAGRRVWSTIFVGSPGQKAPGSSSYGFFSLRGKVLICKNLGFCRSCQCFVRVGASVQRCHVCTQNPRKIAFWDLQNHARGCPNPPKIEPGAPQDAQKPAKSDHKRSRKRKMRPRRAQEPKLGPTWLQYGVQFTRISEGSLILWPGGGLP